MANETKQPMSREVGRENISSVEHDFGATDRNGRALGALILLREVIFEALPDGDNESCCYQVKPGRYFVFRPVATRSGRRFGASQHERFFATAHERDAAIAAYLKSARARAAKDVKA